MDEQPAPPRSRQRRHRDPDVDPAPASAPQHRLTRPRAAVRIVGVAQSAALEFSALVLPTECVCCGAEDCTLCAHCSRSLRRQTSKPFRAEGRAPSLMREDGSTILQVVAAGVYRDELAMALLSFKRHGQRPVGRVLSASLRRAVESAVPGKGNFLLIPIPTSRSAFQARGFSPVELLLRGCRGSAVQAGPASRVRIARYLRLAPALGKPWATAGGQKGLTRGARARRVRYSMRVPLRCTGELTGWYCILVDDVLTTGATLAEAARAVTAAGGLVCGAVVLAATRPPDR